MPLDWRMLFRPDRITDGVLAREGDPWDCDQAAVLGGIGAMAVYDLGAPVQIDTLVLQADPSAGLLFDVSIDSAQRSGAPSIDGHKWQRLWPQQPSAQALESGGGGVGAAPGTVAPGAGLMTRRISGLMKTGQFLRISVSETGQGPAAISELQVFCDAGPPPAAHQGAPPVVAGKRAPVLKSLALRQAWQKLLFGLCAIVAFGLAAQARRRASMAALRASRARISLPAALGLHAALAGAVGITAYLTFGWLGLVACAAALLPLWALTLPAARRPLGATLGLGLLALCAACAWTNFGSFGGYWSVHYHDAAHYFLGAKYAAELRYDRLYLCMGKADLEAGRWPIGAQRVIRDLATNELRSFLDVVPRDKTCKAAFSPARWQAFRDDVLFFQSQIPPPAWAALFGDHGYNATPVWTYLAGLVLRDRPATRATLAALAHVDEAAYAVLLGVVLWGFGLEGGTLAALSFSLGFPWVYQWTGGGLGRSLWLFGLLASIALLRRRRATLAGVALGVSGALLALPLLLLAGPGLLLLRDLARSASRRGGATARSMLSALFGPAGRVVAAAIGTLLLLVTLSASAYPGSLGCFLRNSRKHAATWSVNQMGLSSIFAYGLMSGPQRSADAATYGAQRGAEERPWDHVGGPAPEPIAATTALQWLVLTGLAALFACVVLAAARPWEALALGCSLPMLALPLSSYYCVMWTGLAPVAAMRVRFAVIYLCAVLWTQAPVLVLGGAVGAGYYAATSLLLIVVSQGLGLALLGQRCPELASRQVVP